MQQRILQTEMKTGTLYKVTGPGFGNVTVCNILNTHRSVLSLRNIPLGGMALHGLARHGIAVLYGVAVAHGSFASQTFWPPVRIQIRRARIRAAGIQATGALPEEALLGDEGRRLVLGMEHVLVVVCAAAL